MGGNGRFYRKYRGGNAGGEISIMNWTDLDLQKLNDLTGSDTDPGPESDLQRKIKDWCDQRGFPCISYWKTKKVYNLPGYIPGWPDMTVFVHKRVILLELKTASGALRTKQKDIARQLLCLGHEWWQVKSFRRFLKIMGQT